MWKFYSCELNKLKMNIKLTAKYKSLIPPIDIEIPNLTILTGVNGAGKTHLLTGMGSGLIQIIDNGVVLNPSNLKSCKYVSSHTLAPNDSVVVKREQLNQQTQNLWQQYQGFQNSFNSQPRRTIENFIGDIRQRKIVERIAKFAKKALHELTLDNFYTFYPVDDGMHNDVFYQNFTNLFKRYQDRYDDNQYKQYCYNIKGQKEIEFLSDKEFLTMYGEAPWDFVNKIIKESKLDYHINTPINSNRDAPFELKLVNNFNGAEIQFSELSSGEKVLMSLTLALYNSTFDFEFPKVLLMDEPDASLHPSMTKQFLDVIERVFVKDKNVKVIITTHSPSTVALANEDNLFVMNKTGVRIEKTTKDKALKILTSGVPSFSVNYENRRQIFVESPYDVSFYERIYQILSSYLIPEVSLSFISSGESRTDKNGTKVSNCGQVINITDALRNAGNKFVYGIIDFDEKNKSTGHIKVLGGGNRYSIENYLLDPILIAALLLREKYIKGDDLGLTNNETYFDLKNLNQEELQKITNFVVERVALTVNPINGLTVKSHLLNGKEVDIPSWYLKHQGHALEELLLKSFPELNALKKGKEESLKLEIINKVIDDIPELVSRDLLDVLKSVQVE